MARRTKEGALIVKARWRLLAFDFDGVIADSMPGQERAWRHAVRSVTNDGELEEKIVDNLYSGKAGLRMFDGIDVDGDVIGRLRKSKDGVWLADRNSTPLMTGAKDALRLIAAMQPVAVATTADLSYVDAVLGRAEILGLFSRIVTDQDVANPKPAPDMLRLLMSEFNASADSTCMVGDTRTDFEMSRAAGVAFVLFASHAGAESVDATRAHSWMELAELLAKPEGN